MVHIDTFRDAKGIMMNNEAIPQREWLPVPEWRKRYPYMGKNKVYSAIRDGTLKSIRIGSKILVASDALDELANDK